MVEAVRPREGQFAGDGAVAGFRCRRRIQAREAAPVRIEALGGSTAAGRQSAAARSEGWCGVVVKPAAVAWVGGGGSC